MRWLNIIIVALFVIATAIFAFQNLEIVTLSFLGFSARVPLAIMVVIIYVLGMATGGSLFALLRRAIARARLDSMTKS
jgi:putative membrane protein